MTEKSIEFEINLIGGYDKNKKSEQIGSFFGATNDNESEPHNYYRR